MAEGVLKQWEGRRVTVVTLGDPGGVATGGQILGTLREVGTDGIMLETERNEGRIEFRPWHAVRFVVEE